MKKQNFFLAHKQFTVFFILALAVVGVAVFAPWIAPKDPLDAVMVDSLKAPCAEYPLGADKLGRDILSRVIYGTRTSLVSTLILVATIFVVGTLLGIIAGYFGGWIDQVIMRIADMMISFPGMILAIAIAGMLGPSLRNGVIATTAVSWTKYARLARGMVLKVKRNLYVEAAVVNGTSTFKILWKHILPNMLTTMTVTAAADMGTMMLELASLSFLGFGAVAPTPEWGLMLNEGRTYMAKAPWLMIAPGIAIVIVVIIFNMLGDSIRDILDRDRTDKGEKVYEKQNRKKSMCSSTGRTYGNGNDPGYFRICRWKYHDNRCNKLC